MRNLNESLSVLKNLNTAVCLCVLLLSPLCMAADESQQAADGSYDVYFGPEAPAGKESNWIQTVPGKGWNMLFRLYGPLDPWFDKTWRPGDPELVK